MSSTSDPLEPYYFQHEPQIIFGREVPSILDNYVDNYPSVVDRFFTRYYYIKPGADTAPYQVLFLSNRICLVCLAKEHPALKDGIKSLSFDVGNKDRSKNIVRGKGKKGGMLLQNDTVLALLTTEKGTTYRVPSCLRGKLLEVNTNVITNPKFLETAGEGEGYLAVVLPKPEHCDSIKQSLLTQEQYAQHLATEAIKQNENEDTIKCTI